MNIQAIMKQAQSLQKEMMKEENLGKEDIELLQDMILIAMNNAMKKVDELTEQKMGKFTNSMPGLF